MHIRPPSQADISDAHGTVYRSISRRGRAQTIHFTMIELTAVIAILFIIFSMVLFTISDSRKKSLKTDCLNNCRRLNMAISLYTHDNDSYYPVEEGVGDPNNYWTYKIRKYLQEDDGPPTTGDYLKCPSMSQEFVPDTVEKSNYMSNFNINRQNPLAPASLKADRVMSATKTMLFICGSTPSDVNVSADERALKSRTGDQNQVSDDTLRFPHLEFYRDANVSFPDNHVEAINFQKMSLDPGNVFWNPAVR